MLRQVRLLVGAGAAKPGPAIGDFFIKILIEDQNYN